MTRTRTQPRKQFADFSTPAGRRLRRIWSRLLDELQTTEHEVTLIPAPEQMHSGHKIRIIQSHNADWYRKFANEFLNCRGIGSKRMKRPRTYIVRADMETMFRQLLADGSTGRVVYAERLMLWLDREIRNARGRKRAERGAVDAGTDPPDWGGIPF